MRNRPLLTLGIAVLGLLSIQRGGLGSEPSRVDQIVARYVEALGGRDKLAATHSLRLSGSYVFNGESFDFTLLRKRPDKFRLEIELPDARHVEASDGRVSWRLSSRSGSTPSLLEGDEATRFFEEWVDFEGPLVDYEDKGHRVELLGTERIDDTECVHLLLHLASGDQQHWFVESESHTLVRKITPQVHPRRGPYERVWYFESYRRVDGLRVPEYFEREDRQFVRAYEVTRVEINVEIPDELFSLP